MPKDVCIVCKKERQIMYASGVCDDCIALMSKVREEMEETLCQPSRIYDKDDESNLVREIYDTVNRLGRSASGRSTGSTRRSRPTTRAWP